MIPDWPEFIQIETTIHCNSNCDFCHQKLVTRSPGFMEERLINKIIDESAGQSITYRPFLQNEPLMDKRLVDIVRYIRRDKTAKVELNTNGGMMTGEVAGKLLDAGLDMVRFSIDGFTRRLPSESGRSTTSVSWKTHVLLSSWPARLNILAG